MGLISELRRRNVLRMALLYLGAAWLVLQVVDVLIDRGPLPESLGPLTLTVLVIGFPIALALSWFYEVRPEGVTLDEGVEPGANVPVVGRRVDFVIIAVMAAALLLFAWDKWWTAPPPERSIAVLPFVNMSADSDLEYFSDGISEEILNMLAKVPNLLVISRSSAFSFKGENVDIPTIAAKLNVAHVLDGSVRRSGNQLRISAQLIKVESDRHLWSETYDRELKSIFAIQDEIAAAVVDALKLSLIGDNPKTAETDPKAYTLYLQARHLRTVGVPGEYMTRERYEQAEALLNEALSIDPEFAPAWTELSHVYREGAAHHDVRPFDKGYELARHAAQKAQLVDPHYGPAYAALAQIEGQYDWNFKAAFNHMDLARTLDPNDLYTLRMVAGKEFMLGNLSEAINLNRRVVALDPVWPEGYRSLARALNAAQRFDEAEATIRMAQLISSDKNVGNYRLGEVLLAQGEASAALAAMEKETGTVTRLKGMAIVQHALRNSEASDAALQKLIADWPAFAAYQIAEVFAYRGENDRAFAWLQRAYDHRDPELPNMLPNPLFANLREDARWGPFLESIGLPN